MSKYEASFREGTMKICEILIALNLGILAMLHTACWESGSSGDGDADASADTDTDSDIDSDIDTDADSDSDSDTVPDTDCDQSKEVQQPDTSLCWRRCPLGQTWDTSSDSCIGDLVYKNWYDATGVDSTDCDPDISGADICEVSLGMGYRLPTREEFVALLEGCDSNVQDGWVGYCNSCSDSSICSDMFGDDGYSYWSSTCTANSVSVRAYLVDFYLGYVYGEGMDSVQYIRCVRH